MPDGGARAVVFTGGPSVGGAGSIVGAPLTEQIRSQKDLAAKRDGPTGAAKHYRKVASRAAERGYAIDLVCASLEETGLHEMRSCVQRSGGVALAAETFAAPHLRASLKTFFEKSDGPDAGDAAAPAHGYRCALELRTSKECEQATLLGAGSDDAAKPSVSEAGDGRTFSWSIGAVDSHFTAGVQLERAGSEIKGMGAPDATFMQLSATYRHADGGYRMRVSTLRLPRLPKGTPVQHALPAFDQLSAAAMAVRVAVHAAEGGEAPSELLTGIDRALIKAMRQLCGYAKGEPASVQLPPHCGQLPGLIFHLRRSPAVRTTNVSPDETAYFRRLVCSLSVVNSLVLVQPTLTGYEMGGHPPARMQLDPGAMSPDRSLLLDTYLKLILCHGSNIGALRRAPEASSNAALQSLESASRGELEKLAGERFPCPETFECDQFQSKARYLVQKLNPDVPFLTFLQGLYQAVVE